MQQVLFGSSPMSIHTLLKSKGKPLSLAEITELKESGMYHKLFSAKEVTVPEHVKGIDALNLSVDRWHHRTSCRRPSIQKTKIRSSRAHPPEQQAADRLH